MLELEVAVAEVVMEVAVEEVLVAVVAVVVVVVVVVGVPSHRPAPSRNAIRVPSPDIETECPVWAPVTCAIQVAPVSVLRKS